MTSPIDVAYVDIIARVKEFRKDIKDLIEKEVKELDDSLNEVLDEVDEHFKKTAKNADTAMKDIEKSTKRAASNIDDTLRDAFDEDRERGFGQRLKNFTTTALGGLQKGLSSVGNAFGAAFGAVPQAVSNLFSMHTLIIALVVALPGLIGLLITLGAALSQLVGLVGLLPGGLAILAATIAPLIIGFQNFGDAIGAIISKDPEKIKEAMLKLAPAARSVVREFEKIIPLFTNLQRVVQQSLFAPLIGDLTRLTKALIVPLTGGLSRVAAVLGQIISDFIDVVSSPAGISAINAVFMTTVDILKVLGPAFARLFAAFLPLIKASLPFLERLAGKLGEALTRFADFITRSIDSGAFDLFLAQGIVMLGQLWELLKSVGNLLGSIFSSETTEGGAEIIDMFTQFFNILAAFFRSTEGKQFLADLTTLALITAKTILGLLVVIGVLLQTLTTGITVILDFFGVIKRTIVDTETTFNNAATNIVNAVASIPGRLAALGAFFANAGQHLINSFIGGFRQSGNFISDVAGDIVRGIKSGLNRFINTINAGIASLDALLPFSLSRIPNLAEGGIARANPGGTIVRVAEAGEDEVISPLSDLKAIIADAAGPSITFGPGSINVSFEGAVPTEDEARTVGQSVGEGILSILARRNIRAQVRAI